MDAFKGSGSAARVREIDLPLGMHISAPSKPKRRWRLSASSTLSTLLAVCVVAGAGAIALRDRPFRTPAPTVVSVPVEQASTPQAQPPAAPGATDEGTSIIRVDPSRTPPPSVTVIRDPSQTGQDLRVAHLPDRALIEETPEGPLPMRAADGRRPFDVYSRPWSGARGARIALVIGGLGVSQTGTQAAIQKLPPEVTLAFASGGNSLSRWMQSARQSGHELVMQVPLEPFDYPTVDPGRGTLLVDATATENVTNLHSVLSRMTNYVGVVNYMGARFVTDPEAVRPMMAELGKRGLMYLDDGSTARSEAEGSAKANAVPFAAADMLIDVSRERGDILKKLDDLERTARANGTAIGIGSAFDTTVDTVTSWIAEARRRGIEIVPITAVANDPERR